MKKAEKSIVAATGRKGQQQAGSRRLDTEHILRPGCICRTEKRGYSTPGGKAPAELVVDATQGFIPLWAEGTVLRWRFDHDSFEQFAEPDAGKKRVQDLFATALQGWGNAVPVRFKMDEDLWDFQIEVREVDECDVNGCVLAQAFFPDGGRHKLSIFPQMFSQSLSEQVETLQHELGHVFGLRHFFALTDESLWPAEEFGERSEFSIMNYGKLSTLTEADRRDLRRLYQLARSKKLQAVNGTPIRLVHPYHMSANPVFP